MLRFSPTILMPGSYPSPSRNHTPPTPADVPVWMSPMSHSPPLSGTNSPSSLSQTPSSDEDQRPSQSSHRAPARMPIRRRSPPSSDQALDGGVSHSGSSMSLYGASSGMSLRKGGYEVDDKEVSGEASGSGSMSSLYRGPSRMSFRKMDYTVDDEEVDGEVSGSGKGQSPRRAPGWVSMGKRRSGMDAEEVGGASGSGASQSPQRVLTRMSMRKRRSAIDAEEVGGASGSGSSQSPNRVLTRMRIHRRSYTTGNEDPESSAQQSSDILSGSESPQSTGHRAVYHPSTRPPTPFMLNTFISMADQYAKTSLNGGGQQGLTFLPGNGSKAPSTSQQYYQPSSSHQGSYGVSDEHNKLGYQTSAAATIQSDNPYITRSPSPIKRKSTPFPFGASYNTSPARLQRIPTIQDPVAPAPIPRPVSYQHLVSQDPLHDSTTQHPVSPVSNPPSLPYQYDVSQDPFRDTFSHYPPTLDPATSASSASTPIPPPDRHDTPSSTTQSFHPGYADPPLSDPIPYPRIRSSPLYKGPPELKHFDPTHTPDQNLPSEYYEPRVDSFVPLPKTQPPAFTTQAVDPRSPTSTPLTVYPRPPRSSPQPLFPPRPTVTSPLHQKTRLGSTGSFDRLPEYTGDTPSPPRQRRRMVIQVVGSGSQEEEEKEWKERVKGWLKIKGRGGRKWRGKGVVRGDKNGDRNEGGVGNRISVEYGYGVEYGNGDSRGDGDRKRLVDRVVEKVGRGKLKERVKSIFRKGGRTWKDV